ncbi:putative 6-phosphofructo-2-kinase/fructose-2,6-bisphosphatase [Nannochloris sp. 'desiccata']|nr:putative 6-phosphofructo-2-kinase/fructose-2,6-bisphosphatase [Chlorella desiccata (nom. nud.)]
MWEYWRHKKTSNEEDLARIPSLDLTPEQNMAAVEEETVVPTGPEHHHQDQDDGVALSQDASQAHIYFKDLKLLAHDDHGESEEEEEQVIPAKAYSALADEISDPGSAATSPMADGTPRPSSRRRGKRVDRQKLVIILVGLPARGKTFICNKIMCYFNWLGHPTRHFNVGNYRRQQAGESSQQNAEFFDPSNPEGAAARQRALVAALDDMEMWLESDSSQVAIFDATNSTTERRKFLRDRFHGRWEYMFLESICNDPAVLEKNYRMKMRFSPDYAGIDVDTALADFKERIAKYESVYKTMTDRTMHYVKLIDMVTGRGHMDVNRISGYIPGKMVFYLMQVCKALGRSRRIWLTRHGESQFNVTGKIGGNSLLSPRGAAYSQLLPAVLSSRVPTGSTGRPIPVAVWTSTLNRTIATAAGLPYPKVQWKALDEIQAGVCDGMTYREVKDKLLAEHAARKEDKLRYRYPSGESYMDVIQRLEPVVIEVERERECTCIVAHQAVLRALYGYFMNRNLEDVPRIEIPLHTLIELVPKADGTMAETRFHIDVDRALQMTGYVDLDYVTRSYCGSTSEEEDEAVPPSEEAMAARRASFDAHRKTGSGNPDGSGFEGSGHGGVNNGMVRKSLSMADLAAADLVIAREVSEQEQQQQQQQS